MKNLITLLACASIVLSCETAPKDAVSLTSKISNASTNNELKVFTKRAMKKSFQSRQTELFKTP